MTKKKPKHLHKDAGRPEAITPDKVKEFKTAFSNGLTIDQACIFTKISKQTYYNHSERHPSFVDEMNAVRKSVDIKAKMNIVNKIKEGDDISSKWWLERKCKEEFSLRNELTAKDGGDLLPRVIKDDL